MIEIPESLKSVFTGTVEEQMGEYVVRIPSSQIQHDAITPGHTYRIAISDVPSSDDGRGESVDAARPSSSGTRHTGTSGRGPPVEEGDVLDVTIETVGDQGDGIAKVDRGFVIIVPGAQPGDEPTVRIETVHENMAFAEIIERDTGMQV